MNDDEIDVYDLGDNWPIVVLWWIEDWLRWITSSQACMSLIVLGVMIVVLGR